MIDLQDKVALITGGGQGLGAAIAHNLTGHGVRVVCADINTENAESTVRTIRDHGCEASAVELDVTDEQSAAQAVQQTLTQYGRIDFLINNAGVDRTVSFDELTIDEWDRVINVNLRGAFVMCKKVLPELYRQKSGHIINIASTAAKRAWANASAYHASKWGLVGMSHGLFVEARQYGVKVTALVAGGMQTPFILERFPDTPLENLQPPENVAQTIAFVLSQPAETIIPEVMVIPMNETSWP